MVLHRGKITEIVLTTIAVGGLIGLALIAPNALQSLKMFGLDPRKMARRRKYYINEVVERLKQKGLVEIVRKHDTKMVRLTQKGRIEIKRYELKSKKLGEGKKWWDSKWRIIIFDIREFKKSARDSLRQQLRSLGLVHLQDSVWVTPWECDEIVTLLKSYHHLGAEVLYITADHIENDKWLRREFGL